MASLQEPAKILIQARSPNDKVVPLLRSHVSATAPAGGAPDGALASVVSLEKQMFVPVSKYNLMPDDIIEVIVTTEGADGVDASDCVWNIPITLANGLVSTLSRGDFANPTFGDYTAVANTPVVVAGHKLTQAARFGGGKLFLDIQDDTA